MCLEALQLLVSRRVGLPPQGCASAQPPEAADTANAAVPMATHACLDAAAASAQGALRRQITLQLPALRLLSASGAAWAYALAAQQVLGALVHAMRSSGTPGIGDGAAVDASGVPLAPLLLRRVGVQHSEGEAGLSPPAMLTKEAEAAEAVAWTEDWAWASASGGAVGRIGWPDKQLWGAGGLRLGRGGGRGAAAPRRLLGPLIGSVLRFAGCVVADEAAPVRCAAGQLAGLLRQLAGRLPGGCVEAHLAAHLLGALEGAPAGCAR